MHWNIYKELDKLLAHLSVELSSFTVLSVALVSDGFVIVLCEKISYNISNITEYCQNIPQIFIL